MNTNEPVVDRHGKPMICVGIWKAASTAVNFKSALSKVCAHYDTTKGDFYTPCAACQSLSGTNPNPGCTIHSAHGRPQLAYSGCVTHSEEFKKEMSKIEEYIVDHYEERSTFQLVPKMLRAIRNACLASNDLYSLMIWTLIIVGIKLFARIDEVMQLKVEDLPHEFFFVKDGNVEALATKIKGKCDTKVHTMALWDDKECPEFSPSRALMVWLAVSGIESGYIFPTRSFLQGGLVGKQPAGKHAAYTSLLEHIKNLVLNTCEIPEDMMLNLFIGTHLLRKTAYLIAMWGLQFRASDVDMANVGESARHKDVGSMARYLRDSCTSEELRKRACPDDESQFVGAWKPIHISTHIHWKAMSADLQPHTKSLPELSRWYVREVMGVRDGLPIAAMYEKVCSFEPSKSAQELFESALADLPEAKKAELIKLNKDAVGEASLKAQNTIVVPAEVVTPSPNSRKRSNSAEGDKESSKKPKATITFSKAYQELYKQVGKDKAQGITLLVQAVAEVDEWNGKGVKSFADQATRRWTSRARSAVNCAKGCYQQHPELFAAANKGFNLSRFAGCSKADCRSKKQQK